MEKVIQVRIRCLCPIFWHNLLYHVHGRSTIQKKNSSENKAGNCVRLEDVFKLRMFETNTKTELLFNEIFLYEADSYAYLMQPLNRKKEAKLPKYAANFKLGSESQFHILTIVSK